MLRLLAAALVVANLLFFVWARGWLAPAWPAPRHGEREPERMAAQVNPQAVTVLPPKAASAALTAARATASVCLQAGPYAVPDLAAAEAALAPAQLPEGTLTREAVPPPPLWLVTWPRGTDPAVRRAREAELTKRGLSFETLAAPSELANVLVLSRHATQAEADSAMAALAAAPQPLKSVRVAALPSPPPQAWLRIARADAEVQGRLLALSQALSQAPSQPLSQPLSPAALAGGFKPCVDRP